jgi:hypothetical protein
MVEGEVTRVAQVRYLQGVTGHGVLSTLFLCVVAVLLWLDALGTAVVALVVAYGVALNGASIWAWDRLRAWFQTRVRRREDADTTRALAPSGLSTELKAEVLTGVVLLVGFVAVLAVALRLVRAVGLRSTVYGLTVGLGATNLLALAWVVRG